jgi:hypothetical protein
MTFVASRAVVRGLVITGLAARGVWAVTVARIVSHRPWLPRLPGPQSSEEAIG